MAWEPVRDSGAWSRAAACRPSPLPLSSFSSNFSNYKARFSMPGDNEGLWYR